VASARLLDKLTILAPQVTESAFQLVDAYVKAGDLNAAGQVVRQILDSNVSSTDQATAHLCLARFSLETDRDQLVGYKDAKKHFSTAIAMDRSNWKVICDFAVLPS